MTIDPSAIGALDTSVESAARPPPPRLPKGVGPKSTEAFRHRQRLTVAAIVVFAVVPSISLLLYLGVPPWTNHAYNAVRASFVTAAVLLPSFLFYLHAVTRRESAFNAFATALNRLGLLNPLLVHSGRKTETEEARQTRLLGYVDRFAAAYGAPPADVAEELLRKIGEDRSGWDITGALRSGSFELRTLLAPTAVTLLLLLGWLVTLPPIFKVTKPDWYNVFVPSAMTPTRAAFLGAYLFSVEMLRRRFILRDLNTNLYVSIATRVILVVGLAAFLASVGHFVPKGGPLQDQEQANRSVTSLPKDSGPLPKGPVDTIKDTVNTVKDTVKDTIFNKENGLLWLAFIIGALPTLFLQICVIWLHQTIPSLRLSRGELPLRSMDGIDIWHEARLDEEDIQDIENLACANLVNLIVNTRYSGDRLVDWVDQAILYTALGVQAEDRQKGESQARHLRARLRDSCIRCATDLVKIMARDRGNAEQTERSFLASFDKADAAHIRTLAKIIRNHPNFPLVESWRIAIPTISS